MKNMINLYVYVVKWYIPARQKNFLQSHKVMPKNQKERSQNLAEV